MSTDTCKKLGVAGGVCGTKHIHNMDLWIITDQFSFSTLHKIRYFGNNSRNLGTVYYDCTWRAVIHGDCYVTITLFT